MKKKVVWICAFANDEVKNILQSEKDFVAAPWISELIGLFRNRTDIDLCIISPNYFNNKHEEFKLGNIKICLYQYRYSFLPHKAYNLTFNYNIATRSVLKIVHKLNPDLIHLHGSENPFYGASLLKLIDKFPTLVSIQGFISLSGKPKNVISQYIRWNRIRFEQKINSKASFFVLSSTNDVNNLKGIKADAKIFINYYPTIVPEVTSSDCMIKNYDIVYYARLDRNKGIEDLIRAMHILKETNPLINAILIGWGSDDYINYIKELIVSLDLKDNIKFAGFQKTQQDVFKLAVQAKVYVLPTHFDGVPGSIRESMYMRIPVVANAVGGIPSLNNDKECVTLVESQNIVELAEKIKLVLNDEVRTQQLVQNGYELILDKYDNEKIYQNFINIYKDMLPIEHKF
jgi:glycosyltransferase involved in cell wall biosynthesis